MRPALRGRHVGSLCFVAILPFLASSTLRGQSGETGNFCVRDYVPGAVCTANDVRIEELTVFSVVEDCADGTPDEAVVVFEMLVSAEGSPDRFDIGAFLALDGGSALGGDSCFHDFLDPPITTTPTFGDANTDGIDDIQNGPWSNLEAGDASDTCGDIAGGTQVIKTLQQVTVACQDTNFDGSADVSVCATWHNNANSTCSGIATAFPGTNSKCSCTLLELGIAPPGPVQAPAIDVSKTPPEQSVLIGEDAIFTILVSNGGDTDLDNITVDDLLCDSLTGPTDDAGGDLVLGVTETWSYECTVNAVEEDFENVVTVTGSPPEGDPVSDSSSALVVVVDPSISVDKTPPNQNVPSGSNAVFSIVVTNTGNVDLENVVIDDVLCDQLTGPTGDDLDAILEGPEIWTYTCTVEGVVADFANVVTATGTPALGPPVSDTATANVVVTTTTAPTAIPTLSGRWLLLLVALLGAGGALLLMQRRGWS